MRGGGVGQNLTNINAGGRQLSVNRRAAPAFQGFVNDLAAAGAPIHGIGSFSRRTISGSRMWSQHAYGNAIDIDQHSRNVVDSDFRRWAQNNMPTLRRLQIKYNMRSGGDWRHPDFGHFEWAGPRGNAPPQRVATRMNAQSAASSSPADEAAASLDAGQSVPQLRADRAQRAQSISPQLKERMFRIAFNEEGNNPRGQQAIFENMFNRASVRNSDLAREARWTNEGGYYEVGHGYRGYPASERQNLERAFQNAVNGGNVANYTTDNHHGAQPAFRQRRVEGVQDQYYVPGSRQSGWVPQYNRWLARMQQQQVQTQ
jgi:hypothetical protein